MAASTSASSQIASQAGFCSPGFSSDAPEARSRHATTTDDNATAAAPPRIMERLPFSGGSEGSPSHHTERCSAIDKVL
jgi:hypothetical protein